MEFRKLGTTDIDVSVICLGTMTFGEQNTEKEAHEQLDYALDNDVNFIDTAEMYSIPPRQETCGSTERFIGSWDKLQTHRDKIVLATKAVGPAAFASYIRNGEVQFNLKNLQRAIDGSLKNLKTDYVDLYQLHWPERPTNFFGQLGYKHQETDFTPFEEVLEALAEIKKQGKVKHFGLSNESAWGAMKYLSVSDSKGLPRMMSIQNPYNLLNRSYEVGLAEVSHRENIGLLAYSPMAFGALSGKYLNGARPEGCRITKWPSYGRYTNPQAEIATQKYCNIAEKYGMKPSQLALAFVNTRPFVTSNIIGATNLNQLKDNIDSINIKLSDELLEEINLVHSEISNPSP